MGERAGAIDIGTNTVLLLVAEGPASAPTAVVERATITRLGQGVDATGSLGEEAMARTTGCLEKYRDLLTLHGAAAIDVVCTSAARDARNGADFIERAARVLGVRPRIIDGREEAHLTFRGAVSGLAVSGPVVVFDVGGGSTEIISGALGGPRAEIERAASLDIGSVRLTERHVRTDPPKPAELDAIEADVRKALAAIEPKVGATVVGVAGTVTTLAALEQALAVYDGARVHGSRLSLRRVQALENQLASMPLSQRSALPGLEPGRADVIVAGAVLVRSLMSWLGATELVVSDRGVRWGLAEELLRRIPVAAHRNR